MVWWLGFGTFTAVAWVQSLVGELRSRKQCGVAKKKKKKNPNHFLCKKISRPLTMHHADYPL